MFKHLSRWFEKFNPFHDGLRLKGRVHFVLRDQFGNIKEQRTENTVTYVGEAWIADQLTDNGEADMSHMAIGTGTGQGAGSTTLATELDRNALTSINQGTGANDNDVIYAATWAAGDGSGALTEAGIFNAASAGTMLAVTSFSVINKGSLDTLTITWTITIGAS